jgi:formyl-CoA transferase
MPTPTAIHTATPTATPVAAPLDGIRVLDLSRILAGPFCGQNLADLGAEVIKVERPGAGDDTRSWGPPFLRDSAENDTADAAYFAAANRGKRSVTINLAAPEGQAIVRALVAQCDVLLENYRVGQLARYGLDAPALLELNPRLIYCSITGFGQTGPWAHRAGYDFVIQGLCGFMSVTGEADHRPGGGPQKAGVAVTDLMTGMYATQAILAALIARGRTGAGQHIDLALLDVGVAMMANMATNYLANGVPPIRQGNAHPNIVPYQTFRAADGWIIVAVGNDEQFRRFVTTGEASELVNNPTWARNADRVRGRETLVPLLEKMVERRPAVWWIEALEAVGVPCGPIQDLAQVFEHPQVRARGLELGLDRAGATVRTVANPVRFSATPVRMELTPPTLGADTERVLGELCGLSADRLAALRHDGVI